jgi:hypothetical protein
MDEKALNLPLILVKLVKNAETSILDIKGSKADFNSWLSGRRF